MKRSVSREARYRGNQLAESIKTLKDDSNNTKSNPVVSFLI
jgi:hypothetical protein